MSLSLTEMNKEYMIEILRGFDSIDTNLGARLAWDAFTLGDDEHVGLLETSDDEDLVSWDKLPRNILARAIREGELIFKNAVGTSGEEIDDDFDIVETDDAGDMTFTPAIESIEALDGLGDVVEDEELDFDEDEEFSEDDDEELDVDEADIVAALKEVGIGGQDIVEVADEELDEELDEIDDESPEDEDEEEII